MNSFWLRRLLWGGVLTASSWACGARASEFSSDTTSLWQIREICQKSSASGYKEVIRSKLLTPDVINHSNSHEIFEILRKQVGPGMDPSELTKSNWILLSVPRTPTRMAAWWAQNLAVLRYLRHFMKVSLEGTPQEIVGRVESTLKSLDLSKEYSKSSQQKVREVRQFLDRIPDGYEENQFRSRVLALPACAYYGDLACSSALGELVSMMAQKAWDGYYYSMTGLTEKIFSDVSYRRPLVRAALRVSERVRTLESGAVPEGFILQDLIGAFEVEGVSRAEATLKALEVLAVYSTRGASIYPLKIFANSENFSVLAAFLILSAGMNVPDVETVKSKRTHYSQTPGVETECLFGRPYHFWMSAYFSYYLYQKGYWGKSAFLASRIAGMGYEVYASTISRYPGRQMVEGAYSPFTQGSRAGMFFHDAGALVGVQLALGIDDSELREARLLSLDSRFQKSLSLSSGRKFSSNEVNDLEEHRPLEFLRQWQALMATDVDLREYIRVIEGWDARLSPKRSSWEQASSRGGPVWVSQTGGVHAGAWISGEQVQQKGRVLFTTEVQKIRPHQMGKRSWQSFVRDLATNVLQKLSVPGVADVATIYPSFVRDTGDIRFLSVKENKFNLWQLSPGQTEPSLVLTDIEGTLKSWDFLSFQTRAPYAHSCDGQVVAFSTQKSLVTGDNNGEWDIYVKDLKTGELSWASQEFREGRGDGSFHPAVSCDGRLVSFTSRSEFLVPGDFNSAWDVFVYDRGTRQLELMSHTPAGGVSRYGGLLSKFSTDSSRLSLISESWDLTGDYSEGVHLYLRDMGVPHMERAKLPHGITPYLYFDSPGAHAWFEDGRRLAVAALREKPITSDYGLTFGVYDSQARRLRALLPELPWSEDSPMGIAVSDDQRWIVVNTAEALVPEDQNGVTDVYLIPVR